MRELVIALLVSVGCDHGSNAPDAPLRDAVGSDAAADALPADSSVTTDAPEGAITCGTKTCTVGMACCIVLDNGTPSYDCIAAGDACRGTTQTCDGPEDCNLDERCCGGGGGGISCQEDGMGACQELCHVSADCSTAGNFCCDTPFRPYPYCAAVCPDGSHRASGDSTSRSDLRGDVAQPAL